MPEPTTPASSIIPSKVPSWLAVLVFLGGTTGAGAVGSFGGNSVNEELLEYRLAKMEEQLCRLQDSIDDLHKCCDAEAGVDFSEETAVLDTDTETTPARAIWAVR